MTAHDRPPDGPGASWDRATFLARLRAVGRDRCHDKHPFRRRMVVRGGYQRSCP